MSLHQGMDGSEGANEAVFPPTRQDGDRWLWGRRQVLAHGPLGRIENSVSLNVTVGHKTAEFLRRKCVGSGCSDKDPRERHGLS